MLIDKHKCFARKVRTRNRTHAISLENSAKRIWMGALLAALIPLSPSAFGAQRLRAADDMGGAIYLATVGVDAKDAIRVDNPFLNTTRESAAPEVFLHRAPRLVLDDGLYEQVMGTDGNHTQSNTARSRYKFLRYLHQPDVWSVLLLVAFLLYLQARSSPTRQHRIGRV